MTNEIITLCTSIVPQRPKKHGRGGETGEVCCGCIPSFAGSSSLFSFSIIVDVTPVGVDPVTMAPVTVVLVGVDPVTVVSVGVDPVTVAPVTVVSVGVDPMSVAPVCGNSSWIDLQNKSNHSYTI